MLRFFSRSGADESLRRQYHQVPRHKYKLTFAVIMVKCLRPILRKYEVA